MDDEVLVIKFILCGGTMWNPQVKYKIEEQWYALAPGTCPDKSHKYGHGLTRADAVHNYINLHGVPWMDHPTTSS
jgi:hypothetical protein